MLKRIAIIALSLAPLLVPAGPAADNDRVLEDPLVLGAWLYRSKCVRCHQGYESTRIGSYFDDRDELIEAMAEDGCEISWSRSAGGPFRAKELEALATFMLTWEEADAPPDLPELPDLAIDKAAVPEPPESAAEPAAAAAAEGPVIAPSLQHLLDTNAVARGGWLYTNNCYRCHLSYEIARNGKGMTYEAIQLIISEGKTSTQMKPFSRMLGGDLKQSEIRAVTDYIVAWEKAGEPLAIAAELMIPPALDPADFLPLRLTRFQPVTGDGEAGRRLYRMNCSPCHGTRGEGFVGPSLRETKPVLRPDLFIKSILKQGVPETAMASWDLSRGGPFSAKDIDDTVFFVQLLERRADSGDFSHAGVLRCVSCHAPPPDHRPGKCQFCHDTIDWHHAS